MPNKLKPTEDYSNPNPSFDWTPPKKQMGTPLGVHDPTHTFPSSANVWVKYDKSGTAHFSHFADGGIPYLLPSKRMIDVIERKRQRKEDKDKPKPDKKTPECDGEIVKVSIITSMVGGVLTDLFHFGATPMTSEVIVI